MPKVVSTGSALLLDSKYAGDEPFMLARNLERVAVIVDKDRVKGALQPACVKHCQAGVMKYGRIKELVEYMELKPKTVLFTPV